MLKTQAIGHLGKDCTVNDVNGKSVINFSLAHSEKYKDAQGVQHEKTVWVECSLWRDSLAIANYLKKGQLVYVEGIPDVRTYQKQDGTTGASLRVRVTQIQLLGGSKEQQPQAVQQTTQSSSKPSQPQYWGEDPNGDLPF